MAYNYPSYGAYNTMPAYTPQRQETPMYVGMQNMGQSGYICRPVASRLEAEAAQIDFFGPGAIMPDLSHGAVYLKRFNPTTGASDFIVFTAQPMQETAPVQYATMKDLEALRDELMRGVKHEQSFDADV